MFQQIPGRPSINKTCSRTQTPNYLEEKQGLRSRREKSERFSFLSSPSLFFSPYQTLKAPLFLWHHKPEGFHHLTPRGPVIF